jgi:hypothetical protein
LIYLLAALYYSSCRHSTHLSTKQILMITFTSYYVQVEQIYFGRHMHKISLMEMPSSPMNSRIWLQECFNLIQKIDTLWLKLLLIHGGMGLLLLLKKFNMNLLKEKFKLIKKMKQKEYWRNNKRLWLKLMEILLQPRESIKVLQEVIMCRVKIKNMTLKKNQREQSKNMRELLIRIQNFSQLRILKLYYRKLLVISKKEATNIVFQRININLKHHLVLRRIKKHMDLK